MTCYFYSLILYKMIVTQQRCHMEHFCYTWLVQKVISEVTNNLVRLVIIRGKFCCRILFFTSSPSSTSLRITVVFQIFMHICELFHFRCYVCSVYFIILTGKLFFRYSHVVFICFLFFFICSKIIFVFFIYNLDIVIFHIFLYINDFLN